MTARRDSYADVGAATRLAIGRAMPGLTLPEARVMLALVGRLTSWSTLGEAIAAAQLATDTGMDERAVRRAVASLARRQAIQRRASPGYRASTYRLPNPGSTDPGPGDQWSTGPGSVEPPNPGQPDQGNPGRPDHHPEDYPRTPSEEGGEREPRGLGRFAALVTTPPQRLDKGEIDTAYAALTADLTPGAVDAALDHLDGQRFAYPRQAADRIRQLAGTSPRRDGRTDSRLDGQQAAALAEARRNTELLQARSQEPHEPNPGLVEQAREQLRKPATRGDAA